MCGRTTTSNLVGIGYFPFFLATFFVAALFSDLAVDFFSALATFFLLASAVAAVLFAFFSAFGATGSAPSSDVPLSTSGVRPSSLRAGSSISTRSDQRMWYVDTSWY